MTNVCRLYLRLDAVYGPQHWWPAKSVFEVVAGAVLTQNTSWRNVEKALVNLRKVRAMSPGRILGLPFEELAALIYPSGFYRVKTQRLRAVCAWLEDNGGSRQLAMLPTDELRASLLSVHGVGAETADAILLYAFQRPVFVVDAYARRLFSRVGIIRGPESYDDIRAIVESEMDGSAPDFNEFHALIVEHGKRTCRKKPRCGNCRIRGCCNYPSRGSEQ